MPLFQCLVPAGSLDADTRAALAQAITTAHCSITSISHEFVDVIFTEYEPTAYFRAGRPNPVSVSVERSALGITPKCEANS